MKTSKSKFGQAIYISSIVLLITAFSFILLEKTQVTDLYTKPTEGEPPLAEINEVDYSPASPTDNDSIESAKNTGTITNKDTQTTNPGDPINVVLTAATQDEPGGPVVVRVLLNDVKEGTCSMKMSKGAETLEYSQSIVNAGTYYNCEALDIPVTDLSQGTWLLSIEVKSAERMGYAEQDIEVAL